MKLFLVCLAAVLLLEDLTSAQTKAPNSCPDGSYQANCKVPPCLVTACPELPEAKCVDDYCGGCKARFYINDEEVTIKCSSSILHPGLCTDGSKPVQCLAQPCSLTSCPKYPLAKCVDDYCRGCRSRYFSRGMEVTDECSGCYSIPVNQCPEEDRVKCIMKPCDTRITNCTRIPEATCHDDYCRGCNARWFLPDCSEVTSKCQQEER